MDLWCIATILSEAVHLGLGGRMPAFARRHSLRRVCRWPITRSHRLTPHGVVPRRVKSESREKYGRCGACPNGSADSGRVAGVRHTKYHSVKRYQSSVSISYTVKQHRLTLYSQRDQLVPGSADAGIDGELYGVETLRLCQHYTYTNSPTSGYIWRGRRLLRKTCRNRRCGADYMFNKFNVTLVCTHKKHRRRHISKRYRKSD
jgi:hypothetical protein